ncbi:class A beta-lactamase [Massilia psychrophila]|uniref:Beta-lactamase n=1 Tax=Massilia psychrophila TaxID=1603353 RepID=A0A2G8SWP6_9BURK|nr:class A beta-lactamase [Massilia psychrophila]PIL38181.1 class A beta-lactamase [Massilia psychrophila]GGE84525.1 beta-lactamase [Massilia psychrophila]
MTFSPQRRSLVLAALVAPVAGCALAAPRNGAFARDVAKIEAASGGRLGVAAFDTGRNSQLSWRGDERFPMASTFKVLAAASILARKPGLLATRIRYTQEDLVPYAPVTERHLADGMTNAELCAAAVQVSDNPAANLLMRQVGGPAGVTAYARLLGDAMFRLDRWEPELNSAIPGDARDTTTPLAMMRTLHKLALGDALAPPARKLLVDWMLTSTTGAERIRAGVPHDWNVADKTGSGGHGTTNTIAVMWPPGRSPIVIAVYFTQSPRQRNDVVAAAARAVNAAFTAV